jgi:uncharacterized membrane protein YfcA
MIEYAYVVVGALTGAMVGLTGVGAGAIMTPTLILLFGVNPGIAVATDLWFAGITKCVGAHFYNRSSWVDWTIVSLLWMGSLPVALMTAVLVMQGYEYQRMDWLTQVIGMVLMLTAIGIVAVPWWTKRAPPTVITNNTDSKLPNLSRQQIMGTVGAGAMLGACVALTSVGAGAIGSVVLWLLHPQRLNIHRLVGTDLVHAIPLALLPGILYLLAGMVDGVLLMNLLLGSLPSIWLTSQLARRISGGWIRWILAGMLLIAAVKIWATGK